MTLPLRSHQALFALAFVSLASFALEPLALGQNDAVPVLARGRAPRLELAPGPCADAWARAAGWATPRETFEAADGTALGLDADAWARPETWSGWAGALERLAARAQGGAGAGRAALAAERAALATLALRQQRWDDAWAHLARIDDGRELARLMPSFLPGVAAGTDVTGALSDGVVLRPAPPPPSADARPGFVDRREAWLRGLAVGEAELDLRIAIEPDGVQIDVVHTGGGAARLALVVPEPAGFDVRHEYLDWDRRDEVGAPLAFEIGPGETRTLYGRMLPEWLAWPASPASGELPAAARAGGLVLVTDGEGSAADAARIAAAARGIGDLFDIDCRAATSPADVLGVAVHLDARGEGRERRLAALVSAVEAFVLGGR